LRANWCDTDTPDPVVPSPKSHEYDVAFVVALALKVQLRLVQLFVKLATGAGVGGGTETVTEDVALLVPLASATVRVTEYAAYECELVTPEPDAASPYVQLYVALARAVLLLPSKLHVSPEQLEVNRATGGVVTGAAVMNAE